MMSPVRKFKTAPVTGTDEKYVALVFGDQGVSPAPRAELTAAYLTEEVMNGTASLVFHNGDISYAVGHVSTAFSNSVIIQLPLECVLVGLFKDRNSWSKPNNCSFSGYSGSRVDVKPS